MKLKHLGNDRYLLMKIKRKPKNKMTYCGN